MKSLSIRDVRKELAQIDELVSREGEVVVTRREVTASPVSVQQAPDAITRRSAREHAAPEARQREAHPRRAR
jgi:hypothetical protein